MYFSLAGLPAVSSPIELVKQVGYYQQRFAGSEVPLQTGEEIIGELTADERALYIAFDLVREEHNRLVKQWHATNTGESTMTELVQRISLLKSWSQGLSTYLSVALTSRFAHLFFSSQGVLYLSVRSGFYVVKRIALKDKDAPIFIVFDIGPAPLSETETQFRPH